MIKNTFDLEIMIKNPKGTETKKYDIKAELDKEDGEHYGNGYHLYLTGNEFGERLLDIRYDTSFNEDKPLDYIINTLKNMYSGEKHSWVLVGVKCMGNLIYGNIEDWY